MKYYLITFGCQMNKSDSERIANFLNYLGGVAVDAPEQADLVLLNTCSVRQSAEDRVFGEIFNLGKLKETKPDLIIAVTGCLPGRDKDGQLRKKMPEVDLFFPIIDLVKLPEMLSKFSNLRKDKIRETNYLEITPFYSNAYSSFVPIQTGCNNFCTYCVVPYARGREVNRSVASIKKEIKNLASQGFLEVTLLGQVVNNYQAPDSQNFSLSNPFKNDFARLLWELNQIEGIKWIHYTAADPQYMTEETISAFNLPKQVNYLHLPVQAGSNSVLSAMNRKYTREKYLKIIEKVKKIRPRIALGTDIIVGFPGETKKDFNQTVDLYKEADFDIAYLAKYSPRSGTPAYKMKDDVRREEKERRWKTLQNLMEEITLKKNQIYLGQEIEVLVEKCEGGICAGHSKEMKFCQLKGNEALVGKIIKMKVEEAKTWVLRGKR